MHVRTHWKKVLLFGLLGTVGCLLGWAVGEVFLKIASATETLIDKPKPPPPIPTPQPPVPPKSLEPKLRPWPANPDPPTLTPPPPELPPFPQELEKRVTIEGGKSGAIEIALMWHSFNDLDLHCIDPSGEEIWFGHRESRLAGKLDIDMNVGGRGGSRSSEEPIEHIRWPKGQAPVGKYEVFVNHYKLHEGTESPITPSGLRLRRMST